MCYQDDDFVRMPWQYLKEGVEHPSELQANCKDAKREIDFEIKFGEDSDTNKLLFNKGSLAQR